MIASASSAERDQRGKIAGRFFRSNEASKRDPETPGMRCSLSSAIFKGFRFDFISTLGRSGPTWRVVDVDEANFQPHRLYSHSHPFFPSIVSPLENAIGYGFVSLTHASPNIRFINHLSALIQFAKSY